MQRNRTAAVNLWTTYRVRDNDSFRASLRGGLIPLHTGPIEFESINYQNFAWKGEKHVKKDVRC